MKKGLLAVVSGPAGSGKGTITRELIDRDPTHYALSVSATTRAPRPGEINGVHYHFLTREAFEALIAEDGVLEYNEYCGNYYGTPRRQAEEVLASGKNLILEIDVNGGRHVKEKFPEAILIMLLPPSHAVQEARLRGRGTETEDKILARLEQAKFELDQLGHYDYVIYNEDDDTEGCLRDLEDILNAERHAVRRHPDAVEEYFRCDKISK